MNRCVIVRTDHLGDLLLTTPLFTALSSAGYDVDVVVRKNLMPILDNNPSVSAVHDLSDICPFFPQQWRNLASWLRQGKYTHLILPYARPKELLWASFFSGIPNKIAMWSGLGGRLTGHHAIRSGLPSNVQHMSDIMLKPAQYLGINNNDPSLVLKLTQQEIIEAKNILGGRLPGKHYIGIHPGSLGNACNLPTTTYEKLAKLILEKTDYQVIVTGSSTERTLCKGWSNTLLRSERIWLSMGELVQTGSDLRMLAAVISQLSLLFVSSTGPLQIASALGIPTISPFCPLPERSAKVWGSRSGIVVTPEVDDCRTWKCQFFDAHCDFRNSVTAAKLFAQLTTILN